MKTSPNGIKKITGYEGKLRPLGDGRYIAYRCPANVPTIYIGCTHGVHDGMIITEAEGEAMFAAELEKFEIGVMSLVKVPLNQNEFDALVSFSYNCGLSALEHSAILARLNRGDRIGAAKAFAPWNKARVNGRMTVLRGLVERRGSEANLFLKPVSAPEAPAMPQAVAKSAEPLPAPVVATGATAATGGIYAYFHQFLDAIGMGDPSFDWQTQAYGLLSQPAGGRLWTSLASFPAQHPVLLAGLGAFGLVAFLRFRASQ